MRQNDVPIVQFDGKRRTGEHLLDAAEHLDRSFTVIFYRFSFRGAGIRFTLASCDYMVLSLASAAAALRSQQYLTKRRLAQCGEFSEGDYLWKQGS